MPYPEIVTYSPTEPAEQVLTSYSESEKRQSQILESLAAAVYTCDRSGYINYNKAAVILWGRHPEIGRICGADHGKL